MLSYIINIEIYIISILIHHLIYRDKNRVSCLRRYNMLYKMFFDIVKSFWKCFFIRQCFSYFIEHYLKKIYIKTNVLRKIVYKTIS